MLNSLKSEYELNHIQYILTDPEGVVLESDNTLVSLAKNKNLSELHPFFDCISSVAASGEKQIDFHCIHLQLNNKECITDIRMMPVDAGIFVVIHELSAHYQNYQAITQSRNESVISEELVVIKNRELEEREKFKNQFIRNFSHEIRNPLTSIIAMTNVLGATALNSDQLKMIGFIKESNTNLQLMLEDILSLNLISSGKLQLRDTLFQLPKLIELLEFTYATKAKSKGIDFTADLDSKLPDKLEGDRLRLFQILTNLLDNAFRYTEKGIVNLKVTQNQKWANNVNIRFEVEDSGLGIPKDRQEDVFESFTQLDSYGSKGTGLGLAIVKNLLELMGSEIKLSSEVGKGSVFYFDITFKYPLGLESEKKEIKPGPKKKLTQDKKYKLLMVEDDERVQTAVFKSLNDTGLFYIDLVNDGSLVIQELINSSYDLVLMDVDLPVSAGDQITRIVRDLPFPDVKNIPIIGLTGNAFQDTIDRCISSGMQAVVTKPYKDEDLLNTILKHLN